MPRRILSFLLVAFAIVFLVLAAATLVPHKSAMISDLGYYAYCPLAPWSTLVLLFLAAVSWAIRRYVDAQPVE